MKIVKGSDLDYLLGFSNSRNVQLGCEAAVEAIIKLTKKYNDPSLKIDVPVSATEFFEKVKELLPDGYKLKIV